MTEYLVKLAAQPLVVEGRLLVKIPGGIDTYSIPAECVDVVDAAKADGLRNMHQFNRMIESRDEEIKQLKIDLAKAKLGGQPASTVRDLILTPLKAIKDAVDSGPGGTQKAYPLLKQLIHSLAGAIPGDVSIVEPKPHDDRVIKPNVINQEPRDNAAAAPEYRR